MDEGDNFKRLIVTMLPDVSPDIQTMNMIEQVMKHMEEFEGLKAKHKVAVVNWVKNKYDLMV